MTERSIFNKYYQEEPFIDRFESDKENAIDVIIPLMHTNELWRTNLLSIYREIPVNRLLLGDGGCIDDSIKIAKTFPRVQIMDQRSYISLGYCLRKLIENVETEWFVYLHSDVYLPEGWFDAMKNGQERYDWFECGQRITILADYPLTYGMVFRPYSGSQMGRKSAFASVLPKIDDDFLYRNEDIVLANMVEGSGYKYGRLDSTFHYHQVMKKPSTWEREIMSVSISMKLSREEEIRDCNMQVRGIIKYMSPSPELAKSVNINLRRLVELKAIDTQEFINWVGETRNEWIPYLTLFPYKSEKHDFKARLYNFMDSFYKLIFGYGKSK